MAPEEPPAQAPASTENDIPLLAILAVQSNDGNLENVDWDRKAEEMSLVLGFVVTAAECRIRAAQLIEENTESLQASAAMRRNNNAGNTHPSNPAQSHPGSSNSAPQGQNVANNSAQPTNVSSTVAQSTQPGGPRSHNSTSSAPTSSNDGEQFGEDADEEREA